MEGSELDFTSCGRFPSESDAEGPGLSSKSLSGLEAYDRRDVFIGNRKSSPNDSAGFSGVGSSNRMKCVASRADKRKQKQSHAWPRRTGDILESSRAHDTWK